MKDKTESQTNSQSNTPSATMTELELLGLHEEGPSYVVFWNTANRLIEYGDRTLSKEPDEDTQKVKEKLLRCCIANPTTSCWEWSKSTSRGYGTLWHKEVPWLAHRLSYLVFKGDMGDYNVCHSCDNPGCINPDHLWLGTAKDNMQDKKQKGRCQESKGEANPRSILTEDDVKFIRNTTISCKELSKLFKVNRKTIEHARSGKTWGHINTLTAQKEATSNENCCVNYHLDQE